MYNITFNYIFILIIEQRDQDQKNINSGNGFSSQHPGNAKMHPQKKSVPSSALMISISEILLAGYANGIPPPLGS